MAAVPEFHLPLAPADLLRDGGPGRYVVQEVLSPRELPPALAGKVSHTPFPLGSGPAAGSQPSPRPSPCFAAAFRAAFRARGALAVLQHFDCVYSVLQ